jgi:hypothetical protein
VDNSWKTVDKSVFLGRIHKNKTNWFLKHPPYIGGIKKTDTTFFLIAYKAKLVVFTSLLFPELMWIKKPVYPYPWLG